MLLRLEPGSASRMLAEAEESADFVAEFREGPIVEAFFLRGFHAERHYIVLRCKKQAPFCAELGLPKRLTLSYQRLEFSDFRRCAEGMRGRAGRSRRTGRRRPREEFSPRCGCEWPFRFEISRAQPALPANSSKQARSRP